MKTRIEYIDLVKGIAIILVVIGHVLWFDLYPGGAADESKLYRFIYSFHMPLFFFLSGLVSKTDLKWNEMPKDLWKRFRTLLVPFFVFSTVFSFWYGGTDFGFLTNEVKSGYWYLWVLFVLYVISYPIGKIGKGKVGFVCQTIVAVLIWYSLLKITENISPIVRGTLSLSLIYKNFPYFIAARLIKQNELHKYVLENVYSFIIALAIWMCSGCLTRIPFAEYAVAMSAIVVVMNVCIKMEKILTSKVKETFIYLGKSSLYIYIFHYFFVVLFATTFFRDVLLQYSNIGIDFILVALPATLSIIGALVVRYIVEREPLIMKYIFNKQ